MNKNLKPKTDATSWECARAIFGNAEPPRQVWEKQFDYHDDELQRLAATPYREIERRKLSHYLEDLAFVELQPELFRYLFPVCLMEWHDSLRENRTCGRGLAEFHYAMRLGGVFEKMMTSKQQDEVIGFFRDSVLERLDSQPSEVLPINMMCPSNETGFPFAWIRRFNSLGGIIPRIEAIWQPWWEIETHGRAVAVLKYCSGLIYYFEAEKQPFGIRTVRHDWIGPNILEDDSRNYRKGWLEPNVEFLRRTLSLDFVFQKIEQAVRRLSDEPEYDLARQVLADAVDNRELVESRIAELPILLSDRGKTEFEGWSV